MSAPYIKIIIYAYIITVALSAYPQENIVTHKRFRSIAPFSTHKNYKPTDLTLSENMKKEYSLLDWFSTNAYANPKRYNNKRKILRTKWKNLLGIDVFYPYFKAKEVEDWIQEKGKVSLFKMKGKPRLHNGEIEYTFKVKF